jgi:hypothetical protein
MSNKGDVYTEFVGRMVMWGLKLGGGLGFAAVIVYFWIPHLFNPYYTLSINDGLFLLAISALYGLFATLIGAMVGASIGLILGTLLALLLWLYFCIFQTKSETLH